MKTTFVGWPTELGNVMRYASFVYLLAFVGTGALAQVAAPPRDNDNLLADKPLPTTVLTNSKKIRALSSRHAAESVDVRQFEPKRTVDWGTALLNAVKASPGFAFLDLPYAANGYTANGLKSPDAVLYPDVNTLRNELPGIYLLNNNRISGTMGGTPETGHGTFNSTYTNPYNVTTNVRMMFDPAAIPSRGAAVTYQGISIECLPERPNKNDVNPGQRGIVCGYMGADTGSGGYPGSHIGTEVLNLVLNQNENSGTVLELNPNFNGPVRDGGITRGLFVTGGGIVRNERSVAIDINHGLYGGGYAPWGTGISIRGSLNGVLAFKGNADEGGSYFAAIDEANKPVFVVDKNGYVSATGIESRGNVRGDASLQVKPHRFATLPSCVAVNEGMQAAVTDSNVNGWGSEVTGGGKLHVLAYCDGSSWTVMAK